MGDEVDFLPADKRKSFLHGDSTTLVVHSQACPEYNFTISLQCLKENVKDEVDFSPVDERQRFLQIDTIILGV